MEPPPGFVASVRDARVGGRPALLRLMRMEVERFGFAWAERGIEMLDEASRTLHARNEEARDDRRQGSGAEGPGSIPDAASASDATERADLALVFTGHRVDAPGRRPPRFPPRAEPIAREMIKEAVHGADPTADSIGLAGGASGGDILFHEVCDEAGVPTRLLLALPPGQYEEASVSDAGADWVLRFRRLLAARGAAPVLAGSRHLPEWLADVEGYSIWQRTNLWILQHALETGARRAVLIALWDGGRGDGPGGTEGMIRLATEAGIESRVLDARQLANGGD